MTGGLTAGRSRVWAALLVVYVVWGSTYLAIRVALRSVPPFLLGASRFVIAGVIVAAIGIVVARRASERVEWRDAWRGALLPGFLFFGLGNGSVAWAEQRLDTGVTSLVVAGLPLWLALADRLLYRRSLSALTVAGIVLGLGGVAVLAGPGGSTRVDGLGVLGLIVGGIAWALGSLRLREAPPRSNPLLASGLQMVVGASFLAVFALANQEPWEAGAPTWPAVAGIAYLVVVGTLVGFMLYVWLLRNAPTPLVATYAFANPIVAVLLGWGLEHEQLDARTLGAAALIVGAVALVVVDQARRSAPATLDR